MQEFKVAELFTVKSRKYSKHRRESGSIGSRGSHGLPGWRHEICNLVIHIRTIYEQYKDIECINGVLTEDSPCFANSCREAELDSPPLLSVKHSAVSEQLLRCFAYLSDCSSCVFMLRFSGLAIQAAEWAKLEWKLMFQTGISATAPWEKAIPAHFPLFYGSITVTLHIRVTVIMMGAIWILFNYM